MIWISITTSFKCSRGKPVSDFRTLIVILTKNWSTDSIFYTCVNFRALHNCVSKFSSTLCIIITVNQFWPIWNGCYYSPLTPPEQFPSTLVKWESVLGFPVSLPWTESVSRRPSTRFTWKYSWQRYFFFIKWMTATHPISSKSGG